MYDNVIVIITNNIEHLVFARSKTVFLAHMNSYNPYDILM